MSMRVRSRLADYWSLTKPDVNLLIGITTAAGFSLGRLSEGHDVSYVPLFHAVAGTLLIAGGTGTLNQWMERSFDALMRRTSRRPVASGRIPPSRAFAFGLLLAIAGAIYLATAVNVLSSVIALATLVSYLFVYTPLKRKTWLSVVVGAVPGAAPPLIGWAAATGSLSLQAWLLYAIVFLWQFPHFMAIAWMYRVDYERAGYAMLPAGERGTSVMVWQIVLPLLLLLPISVTLPVLVGRAGPWYLATAVVLGAWFAWRADRLIVQHSNAMARRLLFASIVYLPLLFVSLMLDQL
jgi:protoheme IX farnesyltransferase